MGPEKDDREEGSEDLFEDLDTFFSSMQEDDWAEPIEAGPAASGPKAEPKAESRPKAPRVGSGDLGGPPSEVGGEDVASSPIGATGDAGAGPPTAPTDQGEMTPEDWTRLRDVLGEEEDEDEFPYGEAPGMGPEETLFGYAGEAQEDEEAERAMSGLWETGGRGDRDRPEAAGPERAAEERPELTLEDLKKAPAEYSELPGPADEPGAVPSVSPGRWDEAVPGALRAGPEGERPEETAPAEEPPTAAPAGEPPTAAPAGRFLEDVPEPSLADVEAAADRVAGEFEPEEKKPSVEDDLLADLTETRGPRTVKVGEPETMLGPAWEDPTARTLGPEPIRPTRVSGRNIPMAVLSAVVLAIVGLILLFIASAAFAILAGAVVLVAQFELYSTTQRRGFHPATFLGLVLGAVVLAGAYLKGEQAMLLVVAMGSILTSLWYMAAPPKARAGSLANIGVTMLGLVYVPFLAGYVLLILSQQNSGRALMLAVIGLTFLYDVAAFLVGSLYGSTPLAPTISPKKSWQGLAGGTIVTLAVSIAFVTTIDVVNRGNALWLGLIVSVFAPLGDLAESALKRDLGVKDMGTIMPGHGGMLDRIDSVLFVAPAAFYFLRLIF